MESSQINGMLNVSDTFFERFEKQISKGIFFFSSLGKYKK